MGKQPDLPDFESDDSNPVQRFQAAFDDLDDPHRPSEIAEISRIIFRGFRVATKGTAVWFQHLSTQQKILFAAVLIATIFGILLFNFLLDFTINPPLASQPEQAGATFTTTPVPIRETPSPSPSWTVSPSPTTTETSIPLPTSTPFVSGCVNVSELRIRSGPSTNSSLVGGALFGDCIDFVYRFDGENGTWVGFNFDEQIGWVSAEFLNFKGGIEALELLPLDP